jgi:hypothetical protein
MKKANCVLAFLVVGILAGCYVPSIHPLYTKQDLIFNPALVGQWVEAEKGKSQWVFVQKEDKAYGLRITQEDKKVYVFTAYLLKVGDYHYLDLFPDTEDDTNDSFLLKSMLPVHTFIRIKQLTPTLEVEVMNSEWLAKMLKESPALIKHEKMPVGEKDKEEYLTVLTAQPKELQAFLVKHEKTDKVWNKLNSLKKNSVPEAKAP